MIVSDSRKFVFVHIPKVAGISLRAALEPFADGPATVLRDTTHETLPAFLARHPNLTSHFKFAFVRNPWERIVSFYAYARARLRPTLPQIQEVDFPGMLRLLDTNAAWLRDLHVMRPQRDFVREDGRLVADFVGRFENLAADFARVCARLGLTTLLPRKNVSHHGAYAGYYDAWGRDFIARRYAGDIDEFGYTFEALS